MKYEPIDGSPFIVNRARCTVDKPHRFGKSAMQETVAGLTLEIRLIKKNIIGDVKDDE